MQKNWKSQGNSSVQKSGNHEEAIISSPILKYPDPNKGYTLFTDASKYAWACVLTQEYQYEKGGKEYKINHPITFASGLFKGSQMNWAALTKEAFAIYSSIKKFSYYLEDADMKNTGKVSGVTICHSRNSCRKILSIPR